MEVVRVVQVVKEMLHAIRILELMLLQAQKQIILENNSKGTTDLC